ncbi:hypothetical protein SUGI_0766890 [Cryptomeria japonica]|nr:hypothetical protein SUGI_0766890 [Cryptomeria japonica]
MVVNYYSLSLNEKLIVVSVYDPTKTCDKADTWHAILVFMGKYVGSKFILGGDFNTILRASEKLGGNLRPNQNMRDFGEFVVNSRIMDCHTLNDTLTWSNCRRYFQNIVELLDCFLISPKCINTPITLGAKVLSIYASNHWLVEIDLGCNLMGLRTSFKFETMWWRDNNLINLIKACWKECKIGGSWNFKLTKKL